MFSAPFPFRKAVTKVLPLFLKAKFFANFFSSFFSRTPRPRRSDALRHHAKASRPPVCFAFAVAKVLPFPFPAKLLSIFFYPFFQLFLKDGTSSTGLLRPCSHGICYFPCSALGMLLLGTVGRTKNPSERSLPSAWCCFGSIEDTATPPIYRLSTMHPKYKPREGLCLPSVACT